MNIKNLFKETTITPEDLTRVGLGIVALILLIVIFIFLYHMPTQREIKRLEMEMGNKKTQLAEAQQISKKKEGLQIKLDNIRTKVRDFEERLPTEKEIPKLLEKFRTMAEEANVQFKSITALPIDDKPTYLRIPFQVKVEGNYKAFGSFLKEIEFGKRFIKTESISLSSEKKGVSQGLLNLSTFMFSEKKEGA